jgi:hypothetical protein
MIRFYMYVIYRLHDFFSKKDTTPVGDTILVLFVVHVFQLVTLAMLVSLWFDVTWEYITESPLFYMVCTVAAIGYYFIVFHNGSWKNWAKHFKTETAEERRRNGVRVSLFCWGSVAVFFIFAMSILLVRN